MIDLYAELSVEISESGKSLDEIIKYVHQHYGPRWRFNRTEGRYDTCIMAIFEEDAL